MEVITNDIAGLLVRGTRKIEFMKYEITETLGLIADLVRLTPSEEKHLGRKIEFESETATWTINVTFDQVDPKKAVTVFTCFVSKHQTRPITYSSTDKRLGGAKASYVAAARKSLSPFVESIMKYFPHIVPKMRPYIEAALLDSRNGHRNRRR